MNASEDELATASPSDGGQLPASSYTPLEMEMLDRRDIDAWLDSISGRLEKIKEELRDLTQRRKDAKV